MIKTLFNKVLGDPHERYIKKLDPQLKDIQGFEPAVQALDDAELAGKTQQLRKQLEDGSSLDDILPEAFAVCREACDRRLGMLNVLKDEFEFDLSNLGAENEELAKEAKSKIAEGTNEWEIHLPASFYAKIRELFPESVRPFRMSSFRVQQIGGVVLHNGCIAEMATGEGKTLAAACPVYLNALSGKGVHVVTVNDYLAQRDAENMGYAYKFLGLSVGVIVANLDTESRKASYASDITYGTNNEFGFDYLRDNMATDHSQLVQRELNYCIIDEVDSILVDEARTPLIISGPAEESTDKYAKANSLVRLLKGDLHFTVDEKAHQVLLTDDGMAFSEKFLGIENLYDDANASWVHHIQQGLRAHHLYVNDKEYVVEEGEVVIIDENTGRKMVGRRYSDGLHQAIEAKEGLKIQRENQTLATITFQNFFLMYNKMSGMTGTADTEAEEFKKIYKLTVVVIPTHKPIIRDDQDDLVFPTLERKLEAVIDDVKEKLEAGRPVLIGTISIEKSEIVSHALKKAGIEHSVLNAKQHAREADVVQFAGQPGRVTVATNMAGRGTDIVLGTGVKDAGGLHVLATERHESRRIDNQLRGRSGRQGDPGSSRYYLCGEDDLLRIFGGDRFKNMMLKMDDGEALSHGLLNRAIKTAQKRVEGQNYESRKHLHEYDSVMNTQRKIIYGIRRRILDGENVNDEVMKRFADSIDIHISDFNNSGLYPEDWDHEAFSEMLAKNYGIQFPVERIREEHMTAEAIVDETLEIVTERYSKLGDLVPEGEMEKVERYFLLEAIDQGWKEHLHGMDHLRDSLRYQGYAQKDPLQMYKKESTKLFDECLDSIALAVTSKLLRLRVKSPEEVEAEEEAKKKAAAKQNASAKSAPASQPAAKESPKPAPQRVVIPQSANHPAVQAALASGQKIGRNDPCPCGSGKKFKKCHGKDL